MSYKIKLYGMDNTDIEKTTFNEDLDESIASLLNKKNDNKANIVIFATKVMDDIKNPDKYLATKDENLSSDEKSLYRKFNDTYLYGNIVGVIKLKGFKISKKDEARN